VATGRLVGLCWLCEGKVERGCEAGWASLVGLLMGKIKGGGLGFGAESRLTGRIGPKPILILKALFYFAIFS
jgi:hypothetical protein